MENNMSTQGVGFTGEAEYMNQFTDEDFKYSAEQFDTDYLETMSSRQNANPSDLSRESLFVKFDPLVAKQSSPNKKAVNASMVSGSELPKATNVNSLKSTDLLVLDTPPKHPPPAAVSFPSSGKGHPLHNFASPSTMKGFSAGDMAAMTDKRMYTDDQVAKMLDAAREEEIKLAEEKYGPEIAALEKELAELEKRPGKVYDECMYVDSILSSQQSLLERELAMCKRLLTENEQLETLMVYCHEKFKEKFLALAEQRDSTLKSEKFKVKSFEELHQRYLKLQEANKKLYKSQCDLVAIKGRSRQVTEELKRFSEECLLKQDELNLSFEVMQKEMSSKLAVERAQTRTIELQVKSLEKDLQQKEQEKEQLTQIAEELMKELRNSE